MSRLGMLEGFGFLNMKNTETALVDVYKFENLSDDEKNHAIRRYRAELSPYPLKIDSCLFESLNKIGFQYINDYIYGDMDNNNPYVRFLKYNPEGLESAKSIKCMPERHKKKLLSIIGVFDKINSNLNNEKLYIRTLYPENNVICHEGHTKLSKTNMRKANKAFRDLNNLIKDIVDEKIHKYYKDKYNSDDYIMSLIKKNKIMFDRNGYIVNYTDVISIGRKS